MEARIRKELFDLGILSNKKGYVYIIEAVKCFDEFASMKSICNRVAKVADKTPVCIERVIKSAIKSANHDLSAWKNYDCLTVKGFITTMYYRCKESANE